MNLETLGKMAELQAEMTPLQIGTQGYFEDKAFDIIGRLRVSYSEGFWNEWYTISSDGKEGWLAEAQGFFAMCFPVSLESIPILPREDRCCPGVTLDIRPYGEFMVDDVREVVCRYSEGELPMQAAKGRASRSADLRGPRDMMATIEYPEDLSGVRVYVGSYQEFDSFKFKHLREIDGW